MDEKRKEELRKTYADLSDGALEQRLAEGEGSYEKEAYQIMQEEAGRRGLSSAPNANDRPSAGEPNKEKGKRSRGPTPLN